MTTIELPLSLPNVRVDGHQYLTAQQIAEHPEVKAFVERFPSCFAKHRLLDIVLFYPEGDAPS